MILKFLSLIKFSHTLFALPFGVLGYALGVQRLGFSWVVLVQVVLAMVLARSAAMGFNRIVDREWDAQNPRTAGREIPSGQISTTTVSWIVAVCCVGFVVVWLSINFMCFFLSPVALAVVLGYSYTKRFTSFAHLVLGLALAIAPVGGYVAVCGAIGGEVLMIAGLVLCWVGGFDIIFALQDREFDGGVGLHSIPVRFGVRGGLLISGVLHLVVIALVVWLGFVLRVNPWVYWSGGVAFSAILVYEHIVVTPKRLDRIGFAFATLNSLGSLVYGGCTIIALFILGEF